MMISRAVVVERETVTTPIGLTKKTYFVICHLLVIPNLNALMEVAH
jgi:hypothetical protein